MLKRLLYVLSPILFLGSFLFFQTALAESENIQSFKEHITVNQDSTIDVSEEINYYFPDNRHGIYRYIPYRYQDKTNDKYFKTPITDISVAKKDGSSIPYSQSNGTNYLKLKIGDPNKTVTGEQTYLISYKVKGVLNYFRSAKTEENKLAYFDDHDELYWNVTGDDWQVPINDAQVSVVLPKSTDENQIQTTCYTGKAGSKDQNCTASVLGNTAEFFASQGPLTIVVGWPKDIVTPITRTYEINLRRESGWFWLVALFTLIFLLYKYLRTGRDPSGRKTIAPEFSPPDNLKPGEMGTLIDERAQNKDISATIIDLAVRGYLKIRHKNKKYTLIKTKAADQNLLNFEKEILSSIFTGKDEVSLDKIYTNFSDINKIKDEVYQNLINKKYFLKNPAKVRNYYLIAGFLVIFSAWIFFWLSWNLVAAIVLSGILILIFASFMPKKTYEGVIAKEKAYGFKEFLYRAERYRVKWQEKEHIFEQYLPYAMIFGIAKSWAKNFSNIYKNPPDWYEGDFVAFSAVVLASEVSSFNSTASASFSPPTTSASSGSSGFGGGGCSGGGFGGGGGSSW